MDINHIGILSAMPEEVGETVSHLKDVNEIKYGDLTLFKGYYTSGKRKLFITLAWSGWGKVSAARAITRLISSNTSHNKVDLIIFTGVAGAANKDLKQWDFVISEEIIQYDLDASPLFPKYVIPALNKSKLVCKEEILNIGYSAVMRTIEMNPFLNKNKVIKGLIATGDNFISDKLTLNNLSNSIKNLDAVEMEGGAIAQVATQEKIPWLVVRTISDSADEEASVEFSEFIKKYKKLSWCFINNLLEECVNLEK